MAAEVQSDDSSEQVIPSRREESINEILIHKVSIPIWTHSMLLCLLNRVTTFCGQTNGTTTLSRIVLQGFSFVYTQKTKYNSSKVQATSL